MDRARISELAHDGTLFLDEIGDLRLEQTGRCPRASREDLHRVGATTPTTVDVRNVAATNRDLQRGGAVKAWFREDFVFQAE